MRFHSPRFQLQKYWKSPAGTSTQISLTHTEVYAYILTHIHEQQPQFSHTHFTVRKISSTNGLSLQPDLHFRSQILWLTCSHSKCWQPRLPQMHICMRGPYWETAESRDQLTPSYTQEEQESSARLELDRNLTGRQDRYLWSSTGHSQTSIWTSSSLFFT